MPNADHGTFVCAACHTEKSIHEAKPLELINHPIDDLILAAVPGIGARDLICLSCRSRYRTEYVETILRTERGEISTLETDVLRSLKDQQLVSTNINPQFDSQLTFGARLADKVAEFGGSWRFIILFGSVMALWIAANAIVLARRPFDPYPFILLNLVLSCLAAIQAPVIMMSQNRQQAKDRLQAEHDYQVNLKAELEIQHLNVKLDQLLTHQWQRLLEIQRIQMELVEDVAQRTVPRAGQDHPTDADDPRKRM
ncbi:MAG: DUF1003 domain-containing protein [Acidobacteria bacterium]|nr:DUF1003 domain-containing protein [Acidobacteriota bacterium]